LLSEGLIVFFEIISLSLLDKVGFLLSFDSVLDSEEDFDLDDVSESSTFFMFVLLALALAGAFLFSAELTFVTLLSNSTFFFDFTVVVVLSCEVFFVVYFI